MTKRTCEHCGKVFESRHFRKGCSDRCTTQIRLENSPQHWQEEELNLIYEIHGLKPFPQIVKALQRFQRRKGWRVRSDRAVETRLIKMGLSKECDLDYLTPSAIARTLKVPRDRPERWVEKLNLPVTWLVKNKRGVRLEDLQRWGWKHLDELSLCDREGLEWLVGKELAEAASSVQKGVRAGIPIPVCRSDGAVYESLAEAARLNYVAKGSIQKAIQRNGRSAGYNWAIVEEVK